MLKAGYRCHVRIHRDRVVDLRLKLCGRDLGVLLQEEGGYREVHQVRRMCGELMILCHLGA